MGRPALTYEKRKLIAEMYQRPMSFRQICDELRCSVPSARKAVLEFGIEIRPKHVVLNNPMLGADNSGANNGMWRGGPAPCPDCGGKKSRHSKRCSQCHFALMRTEANPNRLPVEQCKTDESKLLRKRQVYRDWRTAVFSRDDYKCVVCGQNTRDLHPHHLEGFTANKDLRFDPDNGATLCQSHHKQFHATYGYGGNTKQQFDEWVSGMTSVAA